MYQFETPNLQVTDQYAIRDLTLAAFGAKEVQLAEREMPALIAIREKYLADQPLKGAHILGSIHMTIQTAVLVDTLVALGAKVSWTSCNIFSTQDHAAAYLVDKGVSVFAWKGQTNADGEACLHAQIAALPTANMILDDGGDLTQVILNEYPHIAANIHGVSEETTTGVHRLLKLLEEGKLTFPAINVNDSVTKSMVDNVYGCQHSLNDAIKRGTDALLLGKRALVIGYGNVGKGSALSLKQEGMLVSVTEIDPICGVQACLNGYELVNPYNADGSVKAELLAKYDVVVTTTGNVNVCDKAILDALSSNCIVCNIGHFDNEIDTQHLRDNYDWLEIKPQVHKVIDRSNPERYLILLSEGRLVNLGNATGHPSAIMSFSFANQVLAQIHLYKQGVAHAEGRKRLATEDRPLDVTVEVLPKHLDEEVARLSLSLFKGELVTLTQQQADYIDVPVEGPYKPDTYRY